MSRISAYNELRERYNHIEGRFLDLYLHMLAEIEVKDAELDELKSSSAPTGSAAVIIEAGDYELMDESPDVIWLYHQTGEGLAIPRDEFADILDALFKQRF